MRTAAAVAALTALLSVPASGQISRSTGAFSSGIAPSTGTIPEVRGSTVPIRSPWLAPPAPPLPGLTPPGGSSRDTNPASSNPNLPLPGTANPNLRAAPMVPNPVPPPPPR